jgi:hypothetical protein
METVIVPVVGAVKVTVSFSVEVEIVPVINSVPLEESVIGVAELKVWPSSPLTLSEYVPAGSETTAACVVALATLEQADSPEPLQAPILNQYCVPAVRPVAEQPAALALLTVANRLKFVPSVELYTWKLV